MRILNNNGFSNLFPMRIKCQLVKDEYGFGYGKSNDFCGSELEIEAADIVKHSWFKYPDYEGVDYGVKCPVCGQFVVIDKNIIPKSILEAAVEVKLNK